MSNKRGRIPGAQNFTQEDTDELLSLLETVAPGSQVGWQRIKDSYNEYAVTNGRQIRDVQSLKNKFNSLANKTKPSGEPNCPINVRRAKEIRRKIEVAWGV